jgi:hypothetical protein
MNKRNARQKRYELNNPEKVREMKRKCALFYRGEYIKIKLAEIKSQGGICPGCGHDFSHCSDKAILMCFEKSHVHNTKCKLRKNDEFFWSCRDCNSPRKQGSRCGYWLAPNKFNATCDNICINKNGEL